MNRGEESFSLFETMIALGMLAVVMLQVTAIQGQTVYSLEYSQKHSKAMWLGKGIAAKLQYEWATRDFSELEIQLKDQRVTDGFMGPGAEKIFASFSYDIISTEWKLPILAFLSGQKPTSDGSDVVSADDQNQSIVTQQLKAIFNDHIMKIATIEVFWPEGARKSSTSISMLLVNQKAVDAQILTMKSPKKAVPTKEIKSQFNETKPDPATPNQPPSPPSSQDDSRRPQDHDHPDPAPGQPLDLKKADS